jgi:hypothetical protein
VWLKVWFYAFILPKRFMTISFHIVLQFPLFFLVFHIRFRFSLRFPSQSSLWAELQSFCDLRNITLSRRGEKGGFYSFL